MDIICIYCPELDKCCYIDRSEITKGLHLVLRVECSRNFQKKKVKMFSDYYKVPE